MLLALTAQCTLALGQAPRYQDALDRLSPSPAPLETGGGFRVEEQPSSNPDAAVPRRRQSPILSLRVPPPLPAFIPSQAQQLPASSQPPRPAPRLQLRLSLPFSSQPFWPLGTGVARGFLAAFDAAWMVRRWAAGTPPLEVLAER